jgi:hypothetical protein
MSATGFPWTSALTLLYPISATIYAAADYPATPVMIAGYGLANLGYLLFAAGIFAGTFRVFGLKKRWKVLVLGATCVVVGTVLSSIPQPEEDSTIDAPPYDIIR